jgi:hypothetical protein
VGGTAFLVALFSLLAFWYGARPFVNAVLFARYGILHVPALVFGAVGIWVGGGLALAAASLAREPPALPDRAAMMGWTIVVFVAVLAVVVLRRPEVEERLPARTRRILDGRYFALGAIIVLLAIFVAGLIR